jgi:hypothetical protein
MFHKHPLIFLVLVFVILSPIILRALEVMAVGLLWGVLILL